MNWLAIFLQAMSDCEDDFTRDMHQRGLLSYLQGWSQHVSVNERGITAEFDLAVKSYMRTFLSDTYDAHDAEVKA
mgnify:CR=1 FL=1